MTPKDAALFPWQIWSSVRDATIAILDATTFLNLSEAWQYWFQGILLLGAAAIYTRARGAAGRARLS